MSSSSSRSTGGRRSPSTASSRRTCGRASERAATRGHDPALDPRARRPAGRLARDRRRGVRAAGGRGLPRGAAGGTTQVARTAQARRVPPRVLHPRRGSTTSARAGPTSRSSRGRPGCARCATSWPRRPRIASATSAGGACRSCGSRSRRTSTASAAWRSSPGPSSSAAVRAGRRARSRRRSRRGRAAMAVEDPSDPEYRASITAARARARRDPGRRARPRGRGLARRDPDAVVVTAAHQYPTGGVLPPSGGPRSSTGPRAGAR